MGVPVLFSWTASRFDNKILHKKYPYKKDQPNNPVSRAPDRFYLDFNGGIHPACRSDPTMKIDDMYQAILTYLDSIVDYVKPKELLFIAIDGVAPKAKMEQQRARRHKAIIEKREMRELDIKYKKNKTSNGIDFNMISPGTDFLHNVSNCINAHIQKKIASGDWKHLTVIFSDSSIPGEGEHKIMDHIREHTLSSETHNAIYGLDSDLIFLNLINYYPETVLVRESQQFAQKNRRTKDSAPVPLDQPVQSVEPESPEYTYLTISDLRDCYITLLSPLISITELENFQIYNDLQFVEQKPENKRYSFYKGTETDKQRLMTDFTFICFMLGNDFLPNLPGIGLRHRGMETIIIAYKIAMWELGKFLINADGITVNRDFFLMFLSELVEIEDYALRAQNQQRIKRISKFHARLERVRDPYKKAIEDMGYVEDKYKDTIRPGEKGWQRRYYWHHFKIYYRHPSEFVKHKQIICKRYLEGMKWTLLYYQGKHSNWTWYYGFLAGPTIKDIYDTIKSGDVDLNEIQFTANSPVSPYVQLMSILPPESSKLIPRPLGDLMKDRQSLIHYNYPIKLQLSMEGKKYLWECHPKLPDINTRELTSIVQAKSKYFTDSEKDRNKFGKQITYRPVE